MKRIYRFFLIAALVACFGFTPSPSSGHGACNTFFSWRCDGLPRWNASAALFSFGVPIAVQITWYQCYPYYYPATVSTSWGYQYTKYTAGLGCQRWGWKKRWYQSRGEAYSPLVSEFIGEIIGEDTDDEDYSDEPNSEEAKVVEKTAAMDYAKRTITVSGINATCRVLEGEPVYSAIQYEIWQGKDEKDSVYDKSKIIYTTHIKINGLGDKAVEAEGALRSVEYKTFKDADGYRNLTITDGKVVLPVPASADIRYIGLRLVSDGGGDEKSTMRKAIERSDEALIKNAFSYEIFPNPVNDRFTIRLQSGEKSSADIRIYDGLGKEVATLPTEQLIENQVSDINVDAKEFSAGTYYIVIKSGDKKYVKSITTIR